MPHRASLAGLPSFEALEVLRPSLAERPGARVSGAAQHEGALVFRAEGAVAPGIYREALTGGAPELIHAGDPWVSPWSAGPGVLAVERHGAAFTFLGGAGPIAEVEGTSAHAGGGTAAVFDGTKGVIRAVSLASGEVRDAVRVARVADPLLSPILSVSDDGREVLFMECAEERGPATLELADLRTGDRKRLLGPGPSWVIGAFIPGAADVVALEMHLGDEPRARLLRVRRAGGAPTVLLDLAVSQPAARPAFATPGHALLLLSPAPFPLATYGPVDLHLVPLAGGAHLPLTRTGDLSGRVRVAGGAVWIEGGDALLRVPFRLPR